MEEKNREKLREEKRPNETMEWRVKNIEHHNQIRRIESEDGKPFFDTVTGEFQISNANGSISMTAGEIVFKDASGNVIRRMSGIRDSIYDGANEVVRLGEL
jgi:hypothetical protein